MTPTYIFIASCAPLIRQPDGHIKFECNVLHSNVDFYFKFDEYSKFEKKFDSPSPKSSFQMKVNFAFHLEIKVPESGGRVERHRIHVA